MNIEDENKILYELNEYDLTASIINSPKKCGSILIPSFIEYQNQKYKIISINEKAFEDSTIKSLEFTQDSEMKYFAKYSFWSTQINKLQIPSSLEIIESGWIFFLKNLKFIEVSPENKNFSYINNELLVGKSDPKQDIFDTIILGRCDLQNVDIPPYIKFIGERSFEQCKELSVINITEDSQLEIIEEHGLGSKLKKIYIPKLLRSIDQTVFEDMDEIEKIEISPENQTFSLIDNKYLLKKNEKTQIFDELVFCFHQIIEAVIPKSVRLIKTNSIKSNKLEILNFQEDSQLERIDQIFFPNLRKITIPKNLKYIYRFSFQNTKKLTKIEVSPENENFKFLDNKYLLYKSSFSEEFDELVLCPRNIIDVIIPQYIKKITDFALAYCTDLSLTFESNSSLEEFCQYSITMCDKISKIIIPASVKSINWHSFSYLPKLEYVQILSEEINIGACVFYECDNIKYIVFQNAKKLQFSGDISDITKIRVLREARLSGKIINEYKDRIQYINDDDSTINKQNNINEIDEINTLMKENDELKKKITFEQDKIKELQAQIENQEAQIKEQEIQIQEKETQIKEQNTQVENQETQIKNYKMQIKEQETQIKEQETQIKEQETQIKNHQMQIKEQEKQIKEQETFNTKQTKLIKKKNSKIQEFQKEVNKMTKELDALQNTISKQVKTTSIRILKSEMIQNLRKIQPLGSGTAGHVVKVGKEEIYAQKIMNVDDDFDIERFKKFMNEYEILNMLNHPNIIKVYGICYGNEVMPPSILMEFCSSNLDKQIVKNQLSSSDKAIVIYQIAEGLRYVHFKKVIHRDIKSKNILINEDKIIRICDFGISKYLSTDDDSLTIGVGTPKYMAPEIINEEKHYTEKVDVYSFGVLVFFILCGKMPNITITNIGKGLKAEIPNNVNEFSTKLINDCWNFEPESRPSFHEICQRLRQAKFILLELSEYEQNEVLNFVETHDKKIPLYELKMK